MIQSDIPVSSQRYIATMQTTVAARITATSAVSILGRRGARSSKMESPMIGDMRIRVDKHQCQCPPPDSDNV